MPNSALSLFSIKLCSRHFCPFQFADAHVESKREQKRKKEKEKKGEGDGLLFSLKQ